MIYHRVWSLRLVWWGGRGGDRRLVGLFRRALGCGRLNESVGMKCYKLKKRVEVVLTSSSLHIHMTRPTCNPSPLSNMLCNRADERFIRRCRNLQVVPSFNISSSYATPTATHFESILSLRSHPDSKMRTNGVFIAEQAMSVQ